MKYWGLMCMHQTFFLHKNFENTILQIADKNK